MTSEHSNDVNLHDDASRAADHSMRLDQHDAPFGQRLRAAREARELSIEACATSLRLPISVLRKLEQGDYQGIDHPVYLSNYLRKYGQLLGVDEAAIEAELRSVRPVEPTLVATGGIPRSRYLLDHYARAATYVVLTAVIVVPVIWLGLRGSLDRDVAHLAPLDARPVAQQAVAAASGSAIVHAAPSAPMPASSAAASPQPLVASMVPNLTASAGDELVVAPASAASAIGSGAHALALDLAAPSWVEVLNKDGSRLEYGLLPAGSKVFRSDQPLEVRIGNASGAQVRIDGQPVALDAYRHANVAHFRVVLDDGKAAAAAY